MPGPSPQRIAEIRARRAELTGQRDPSRIGAAARGLGQGFTVGLSDEMMGLARGFGAMWPGGMTPGEGYTAGTEGARERNRASRGAYPWTYGAGEITGAVAPMVAAALMTAPAGGAGAAPVAASTAARVFAGGRAVARGAATRPGFGAMSARTAARPLVGGAIEGGLQGYGHAEGMPWERAVPTALGGGVGLVAGGLGQGVARAGGWAGGRAIDLMGVRPVTRESAEGVVPHFLRKIPGVQTIQEQAERRVAQALPEGGQLTPGSATAPAGTFEGRQLQEAVEQLDLFPDRAVMDVSRRTQGAARGAATVPGPAKESIPEFLRVRHRGQEERVIDQIFELSEAEARQSFREASQEIMARRAAAAKPLYDAAYNTPEGAARTVSRDVVNGEDFKVLDEKHFQDAYERGRELARLKGVDLPPLTDDLTEIPVQAIDYMKRGMNEVIETGQRKGVMGRDTARELQGHLRGMLTRVDDAVEEFGQARAAWKGGAEELEALEAGRRLFTDPVGDTEYLLREMGESEREMFVRGGAESLAQRLENIPSNRDLTMARPLADRTADTQRMRMLFDSDEAFETFQGQVANEVAMGSSNRFVNQQSMTVDKALEVAEMSGLDPMSLFRGGAWGAAASIGREMVRGRQTSYTSSVAEQMAPILTAQGQDAASIVRRLMGPQQQQSVSRELVTQGAPGLAASSFAGSAVGRAFEDEPGVSIGTSLGGPREREMAMGDITDDQMAYLRAQGLTDEQIALIRRSVLR